MTYTPWSPVLMDRLRRDLRRETYYGEYEVVDRGSYVSVTFGDGTGTALLHWMVASQTGERMAWQGWSVSTGSGSELRFTGFFDDRPRPSCAYCARLHVRGFVTLTLEDGRQALWCGRCPTGQVKTSRRA